MCKMVVIDVEMCRVKIRSGRFPLKNEIIQIGAVMLDEAYHTVDEFSTYVRPEYGKVDNFIAGLTGISERDTRRAPFFADAIGALMDWIGGEDTMFYAWSDSDYCQIRNEARRKLSDTASLAHILNKEQWIDYQKVVDVRFDSGRQLGLSEALELAEVNVKGRMHDGLDDARNTAGLIAKLELHPEFKPVAERLHQVDKLDRAPLSTSLAGLLQGLVMAG